MKDVNRKRIERLKIALDCLTDKDLASKIGSYDSNVCRWKKSGFHVTTANIIDALLDVIESQKRRGNHGGKIY